ncbi:MAG: 16S rRNA (cytosine(967)-C(5))-methyltransferase RsmB [Gammaproteobacteria bacterium]|nr:16S rRNA (cytosine(967)-C(5))-methyltransferase RsmB [Gammaproteobacteria bacterium]
MASAAKRSGAGKAGVSVARLASLKALKQVLAGQSLSVVQGQTIDLLEDKRDRGLANEIVNGVLRWRWQLEFFITSLLAKPLKKKELDIQLILMMALYELAECRTPDYAIINESVELVRKSGKKWAASLVNAVLRNFTREKETLISSTNNNEQTYLSHPQWILDKVKRDWPDHWRQILMANNQRPAFWLRVNHRQTNTADYQRLLAEHDIESEITELACDALKLIQGADVRLLPGFTQGMVSVQDAGAQLAAELLNIPENLSVVDNFQVLDLCAAPGGKTCHILERHPTLQHLLAVELDEHRMQRVSENLQRLKLTADLMVADARDYKQWWSGRAYDRILIDAPCSASAVIRRHPDIKTLRRESDIPSLVKLQAEILSAAWQMLAVGGELLYVTCSIFKDENERQIETFFANHDEQAISELKIDADWGQVCKYGRQLLPGEQDADGFYFCRLKKISTEVV